MKGIKGFPPGELHHLWKGEKVGYKCLHAWLNRVLGTPKNCEHCHTKTAKKYEWANLSGEYKRDPKDWIRLCTRCHIKMDGRFGEGCGSSVLTEQGVINLRNLYSTGEYSYKKLAKIFQIGHTTVSHIIKRRTWSWLK